MTASKQPHHSSFSSLSSFDVFFFFSMYCRCCWNYLERPGQGQSVHKDEGIEQPAQTVDQPVSQSS